MRRRVGVSEPGMRDTYGHTKTVEEDGTLAKKQFEEEVIKRWKDMDYFPWASEFSRHARVMKDGKMIRDGAPTLNAPPE